MILACELIALTMAVALCVGVLASALRRLSLAQSLCVQTGAQIQNGLGRKLTELLRLNPAARRLRIARARADERLRIARASKHPATIAVAQAAVMAVQAQQFALSLQQRRLLTQAEVTRKIDELRGAVTLRSAGTQISFRRGYEGRALAVRPSPPNSPSPDYVLLPRFRSKQSQTFKMSVLLIAEFLGRTVGIKRQVEAPFQCSVTLNSKGGVWEPDLLAASAPSN